MEKKLAKLNHILIAILIIAQPFIVMFQAMVVRDIQIFGISAFESFNILVGASTVLLTIITHPNKKKFIKYIPYCFMLGAYLVAHGLHIYQFDQSVYSLQNPSFLVETYYIVRTFIVPLMLIFSVYYSHIEKEQIIKILEVFLFTIAVVMVVTNLFHIALRNYTDVNVFNEYNLFDWIAFENSSRYSYYKLTTKGWFLSGNQMAAILFMSFPVVVYRTYLYRDAFRYSLLVLQMIAMYMLGTKVANIGCLLIMVVFFVAWKVFELIGHDSKRVKTMVGVTLLIASLFPYSPVGYMMKYRSEDGTGSSGAVINNIELSENLEDYEFDYRQLISDSKILVELDADNLSEGEKQFVKKYLEEYFTFFGISPYIFEHYNDLDHSIFWTKYLQNTTNNDYRVLKNKILEDIYNNNNNPRDKYLGMGYTLNFIYTESDFYYQYYSYGILGMIVLMGPYFYVLCYVVFQGLRKFKQMFTLECAMYFIAPLIGIAVAKFSGHVFERTFPLITLAILIGIVLIHTRSIVRPETQLGK